MMTVFRRLLLSWVVLSSILLFASPSEAAGVHAQVTWLEPDTRRPAPWQRLTLATGVDDDCTEFVRSLPKDMRKQLGAASTLNEWGEHEGICAIGPAHVLLGPEPGDDRRTQIFLLHKASARIMRPFNLPKGVESVWAKLVSTSDIIIAYNEPYPENDVPAENPAIVWFVNPRTGGVRQKLVPAKDSSATIDERTGIVVARIGAEPPLELKSGTFCDRVAQTISRSKTRILVFQTCVMYE